MVSIMVVLAQMYNTYIQVSWYSVMQSDRNNFCGDVVLDSFNMAYKDKDSILDKIYEKPIFYVLYHKDF